MRLALLVLLAGCSPPASSFRATNPSFKPQPKAGEVEVFSFVPPSAPYDEVGVITVKGETTQEILERAKQKAREVGCDLIVARARVGEVGTEPLGAQTGTLGKKIGEHPGGTIGGEERRGHGGEIEFTCGLYNKSS